MKFVVTGATGFIGREIVDLLSRQGHRVYCVCRPHSPKLSLLPKNPCVHIVSAVLSDYAQLDRMIPEADVFIHFAWDGTTREGRDIRDVQADNVGYALAAMDAAKAMGCRVFVGAGSQAEYGVTDGLTDEASPCHPFSYYGKAKLALLEAASRHAGELGIQYLHLRIFSVYGENDHPWAMISSCTPKLLHNEDVALSGCRQRWNFLYVRDCAKQVVLLSEWAFDRMTTTAEVFNLASEDTRILKSYIEEMHRLTKSDSQLLYGMITPSHPVSLNPDVTKLKNTIGFVSDYSFSQGYQNVIEKYRNE